MFLMLSLVSGKKVLVNPDYIQEVGCHDTGSMLWFSGDTEATVVIETLEELKELFDENEIITAMAHARAQLQAAEVDDE